MDKIAIEDAEVLLGQLALPLSDEEIFERLQRETGWRQEKVRVWGKEHLQPRLTAWYGDPGKSYAYSGTVMHALPWTGLLRELRDAAEQATGAMFNSVLLNLYRDQSDRMGFHSDNEPELGERPVIASLSYGAARALVFRHRTRKDLSRKRVMLLPGSLLLMKGPTQANWLHGIERQRRACGPRINLTFRKVLN